MRLAAQFVSLILLVMTRSAFAAEFFVAPRAPLDGDGSIARPFASIERARDAVRSLRAAAKLSGDVTVWLRGGAYPVGRAIEFRAADSHVTYAAYRDERPVLEGGAPVPDWRQETVNGHTAWIADLPEVADGSVYYKSMFVNGQRRPRARWPTFGQFLRVAAAPNVTATTRGTLEGQFDRGTDRFTAAPGDFIARRNLNDVDAVVLHYWSEDRLPVLTYDPPSRLVRCSRRSNYNMRADYTNRWARYYLDNVEDGLTEPGEWYLERTTGKLMYLPQTGETLRNAKVYLGRQIQLVKMNGAQGVVLRGLTLRDTDWTRQGPRDPKDPMRQWTGVQSAFQVPAAVVMDNCQACRIDDCALVNLGGYAVDIGDGCRDCAIVGCDIASCAAGGIKVNGADAHGPPSSRTGQIAITDNHIHDFGQVFHSGTGVLIRNAYAITVAHNHIHDGYYSAICCGWVWGYRPSVARDNHIEFNLIHDLGKAWLSDMGGVYTLGPQPGTVIRNNVIHDVTAATYGGWGIYTDEGSSGILIENNLLYRFSSEPFHQHYGRDNTVRNNVLAFGHEAQARISDKENHPEVSFDHNVFLSNASPMYFGQGAKGNADFTTDHNVLWDTRGKPIEFHAGITPEQWHAAGKDVHSTVADPGFTDADHGDFSLKPNSAAAQAGFKPIDISTVGPRAKGNRVD